MDAMERRIIMVLAVVVAIVIYVNVDFGNPFGPERSVESYCQTWKNEGEKLHKKWADQQAGGDPGSSISMLFGAPADLAEFFDKLDEVAPKDIEPDVARYRDAWQKVSDLLGENATDPLSFLMASLMVSSQSKGAETRINKWTQNNCGSN